MKYQVQYGASDSHIDTNIIAVRTLKEAYELAYNIMHAGNYKFWQIIQDCTTKDEWFALFRTVDSYKNYNFVKNLQSRYSKTWLENAKKNNMITDLEAKNTKKYIKWLKG